MTQWSTREPAPVYRHVSPHVYNSQAWYILSASMWSVHAAVQDQRHVCFHTSIRRCCYVITLLSIRQARLVINPKAFYSHVTKVGLAVRTQRAQMSTLSQASAWDSLWRKEKKKKKNIPSGYNSFTGSEWGRQDQSCLTYILHSQQSWIKAVGKAGQEESKIWLTNLVCSKESWSCCIFNHSLYSP